MKREDFLKIHAALGTPEYVKNHCMAVGDAAANICKALQAAGLPGLDLDAVRLAGFLHDIARSRKDHGEQGAAMIMGMDFVEFSVAECQETCGDTDDKSELVGDDELVCEDAHSESSVFLVTNDVRKLAADIVSRHMVLQLPERAADVDSTTVVSLADRIIQQDVYVGYEARLIDLRRRYSDIPEVGEKVNENMDRGLALIASIEEFTGRSFDRIATGGIVDISTLLPMVERPGRYIGGEIGSVRKEWDEVSFRFCFAFPDLYELGMSNTAMQILYGLTNERPDTLCERVFAPAADMAALLKEKELPLFSLENRMPVRDFDIVGFTLQYELCYTNIVRMLKLAGIPLYASERGDGDPIVIAGGPCCANAEPVAPFFDLICVGDGEELLPAIAGAYVESYGVQEYQSVRAYERDEACETIGEIKIKEKFLLRCSKIPGVFSPSFFEPSFIQISGKKNNPNNDTDKDCETNSSVTVFDKYIKKAECLPDVIERAVVEGLETAFFPTRPLVSHIESVHDRVAVEIMRGCYRKCRFCLAGYAVDGVRKRSPERIKELLFEGLANTGYDEVTLLSLSTGDYPGIEGLVTELMEELSAADATLSMPSLRLDSLKEETLAKIAEYKRTGLTFAPEAGTQRLRDHIGKQLTEDDIMRALDICLPLGFTKFKFYFMIGLPGETDEDVDGIAELAGRLSNHARALGAERGEKYRFNLSISVSNFVPKPGTPFERESGNGEVELLAKVHRLKDAIRKVKGANFKYHDTRISRIEMLLAKGDRRMSEVVRIAAEKGQGFDSWREHFSYENWLSAFSEVGLPAEDLYTDEGQPLPWSLIGQGKSYEVAKS